MSVGRAGELWGGAARRSAGGGPPGIDAPGVERRWGAPEFANGANHPLGSCVFAIVPETRFGELTCRYGLQRPSFRGTVTAW